MNTIDQKTQEKDLIQAGKQVGNTPLLSLPAPFSSSKVKIHAKLEWHQLGGSVKARAAYQIIKDAWKKGKLGPDKVLLDASSGNTAIAYASIGARLDIKVHICLPENASAKRKKILNVLGAEITYTSPFEGTDGAQEVARAMKEKNPDLYYYADQYNNSSNSRAHYKTTGPEILKKQPGITHFICGLGTSGSFSGTSAYFKEYAPHVKAISIQPDSALHGLEGWKHMETAKVPGIYKPENASRNIFVDTQEALDLIPEVARHTGLLLSPSSAANLTGALQIKENINEGHIVTLFPDDLMKYDEILKQIQL
jgi:cysteine synthase B